MKKEPPTLEELMRPTVITCGQCGGDLHIIPVKEDSSKSRICIRTINICGKCTFEKGR